MIYIVWNNGETEGFATTDRQLAYEVRKSSDTNCYDFDGNFSRVAADFCDRWGDENCTIQEVSEHRLDQNKLMFDLIKKMIAATEGIFECGGIRSEAMELMKGLETDGS